MRLVTLALILGVLLSGSQGEFAQPASGPPQGSGSIAGTILYADGTAAHTGKGIFSEVAVNVERLSPSGTWQRYGGAAHTDEQGRYRMEGLAAGKYVVFAAFPGEWVTTAKGKIVAGGPFLFAPGTPRLSKATIIAVSDGEAVRQVNVQVPQGSGHHISGVVVNSKGNPSLAL